MYPRRLLGMFSNQTLYQDEGEAYALGLQGWVEKRLPEEIRRLSLLRSLHLAPAYYQTTQEPAYESVLGMVGASAPSLREVRLGKIMWRTDSHGHWTSTRLDRSR